MDQMNRLGHITYAKHIPENDLLETVLEVNKSIFNLVVLNALRRTIFNLGEAEGTRPSDKQTAIILEWSAKTL